MICMDDKSYKYLNDNPLNNVQILHIKELEKKFPLLKIAKLNRNRIEYFFTCSQPTHYHSDSQSVPKTFSKDARQSSIWYVEEERLGT